MGLNSMISTASYTSTCYRRGRERWFFDCFKRFVAFVSQFQEPEKWGITRRYCTTACIRGLLTQDFLGPRCPNVHEHGVGRHPFGSRQCARRLHSQLLQDRESGFEQLHLCGRTGFILKAILLFYGYTIVIKATSSQREVSFKKRSAYTVVSETCTSIIYLRVSDNLCRTTRIGITANKWHLWSLADPGYVRVILSIRIINYSSKLSGNNCWKFFNPMVCFKAIVSGLTCYEMLIRAALL
jgi:hypothetical protein